MLQMRIFVSHSSGDSAFCKALVTTLRERGADVWYDEHNLGLGQFRSVIAHELENRSVFVLVLSEKALQSPFVQQEFQVALDLYTEEPHREIVPVVAQTIDRSDLTGMWRFLSGFKRIEAPGYTAYSQPDAIQETLRQLGFLGNGQGDCTVPVGASPEELVTEGKSLYRRKQYACSAKYCERATQLRSDYLSAWYNLAYALFDLKRFDEGLAACERALTLSPKNSHVWNLKGQFLACLNRDKEALSAYARAVEINPNVVRHWYNKADALVALGRYAEALVTCDQAIKLSPNNMGALLTRIDTLGKLGHFDEALAEVDRLVSLYPNQPLLWNQKGLVLQWAGRHEDALAAFNHSLALAPKLVPAWESRAKSLAALDRDKEARDSRKRARELAEQGEGAVIFHGWHTALN